MPKKLFSYVFFVALHDESKKIRKKLCRVAFDMGAPYFKNLYIILNSKLQLSLKFECMH